MMAARGHTVPLFPNRPRELLYPGSYRSFNTRPAQHRLRDELRAEVDRPTGVALARCTRRDSVSASVPTRISVSTARAAALRSLPLRAGRSPRRRRRVGHQKPMTQREHPESSGQSRTPSSTEPASRMTPVRRRSVSDAGLSAAARTGQSRSSPNNAVRKEPIGTRLRSGAPAISLPSDAEASLSSRLAGCGLGPRPATTRAQRDHTMHDRPTPASEIGERTEQLTAQLTAFNRVLLRGVKSKSQYGSRVYSDLTDLTDSLRRKDIQGRVRAHARAPVASASLASERIGKFGKIGGYPRAVMRFSVNRRRSNGVESQLISSKIAGWSA
jgi:hypothetical protein